ncbi:MAG TPA: PilZ domain-containing protein [Firmicutes bacterium]|jgi:hypothetical protein|nr:PilZ domain-containing protein [Bacillota bacterium]
MEKRELIRVPFQIDATILHQDQTYQGKIDNLSLKGMFIQTDGHFKLRDMIQITVHLAGESSDLGIKLSGIIVRINEQGIGVQFEKVDLDSFIHLRNIVAYNSGDEDKVMDEFCNFINHKNQK